MTILAEPSTIISTAPYPAEPATPAASKPRHRSITVRTLAPSGRRQPVDAPATTQRSLRQRDHFPAEHPDRKMLRDPHAPGPGGPDSTVDTWPLRETDPVGVDGYRLVSRLGAGGMADVFYALAPNGRQVAVKILRAADGANEACQREYRLAYAVDADCTAPALDHGRSTAGAYLVTAYLPGYRCGTTLVSSSTPARPLWTLGSALARVLAAIHAKGIVHCDVKPSNLLVQGHDVRVIDFGIARYVGEPCADDGIVHCTRGWAAPEQLRAAPATPAIDIFAWGCLLAHLASGVHPFASRSEKEWILRIQAAEPDLSGLPADLDDLVRWTLARNPQDRPSAHELATICQSRPWSSARAPASRRL
jgi:serine/threonine protein kinase